MAEHSTIEWTDATWQPITGCSVVSPGCTNCYAMGLAGGRLQHHLSRAGLTTPSKAGPVWNGQVRLNAQWLTQPLSWKRPRRIFVCAHGDLFHEAVPDAWIDQVFAVMALAPRHTFQVLTKRAARMRAYLTAEDVGRRIALTMFDLWSGMRPSAATMAMAGTALKLPLPNVWLGVSAEDQPRADERISDLLTTPAAVRFLSAEPLLGPIDITVLRSLVQGYLVDATLGTVHDAATKRWVGSTGKLHWLIAGGESGPRARPMHPDWARQLRDDCAAAGVAFFFKQWGEWAPDDGPPVGRADTLFPEPAGQRHLRLRPDQPLPMLWSAGRWLNLAEGEDDVLLRYGKKAAGRRLDGREHNDMPPGL